jgi:hypothetical protein
MGRKQRVFNLKSEEDMTTVKEVTAFFKATKGCFVVCSFDKTSGRREATVAGCDMLRAFIEMANSTRKGFDVLLLDDPGHHLAIRWEMVHGQRIDYNTALLWSVGIDINRDLGQVEIKSNNYSKLDGIWKSM